VKKHWFYIKQYLFGGELSQDKVVKHIIADRIEKLENEVFQLKGKFERMIWL